MPEYIDKLVILNQISELKSFYEKERKLSRACTVSTLLDLLGGVNNEQI